MDANPHVNTDDSQEHFKDDSRAIVPEEGVGDTVSKNIDWQNNQNWQDKFLSVLVSSKDQDWGSNDKEDAEDEGDHESRGDAFHVNML